MKTGKTIIALLVLMMFLVLNVSCKNQQSEQATEPEKERPELLIYCGITMVSPIMEIIKVIEKERDCSIKVTYGGSLHLKQSIAANKQGDLYFPGNDSFLTSMLEDGTVTDTAHLGYNKAIIMVQKGNPKNIDGDLQRFTDPGYSVVIGAQKSGSIGRESKKILTRVGIYEQVIENALYLSTDSKGLSRAIRNQDADMVINWNAAAFLKDNVPYIDVVPISEEYATKRNLVLGLLKYSQHRDIAARFMEYAASEPGQEIFKRYGFVD
ncbi:MAG: substrate-binding domain-containing protein [Thermodesulfobacteriota bacterium]